jgi:tRNA(Ile)-lysidine synthase
VAVAVSGGSDSVALFRILLELESTLEFAVAGVIHVNHQLRGVEADRDEQFCRTLARSHGRAVHVERVAVVRAGEDGRRRSPEDAARHARYAALERGATALAAPVVALGHTEDDQAETVVLRLLRGTGPDGLAAIPARRVSVNPPGDAGTAAAPVIFVRPLLQTSRASLRAWLHDIGQDWVEDASNANQWIPRNAVRHAVMPAMSAVSPAAASTLARHAAIASDEAEWLESLVNPVVARLVHQKDGRIHVERGLADEPVALQRRVVLAALRQCGARQPGFEDVEAVRGLVASQEGARELPGGLRANRIPSGVVLTIEGVGTVSPADYRYMLRVPGGVEVPEASAHIEVVPNRAPVPSPFAIEVEVDAAVLARGVTVRNWRPGDAVRPAGLNGGRKKLQDLFVDAKVPRQERHRLPLLVDEEDRVLWVPGLAMDARLKVTGGTKAVVVLRLTRNPALPVGGLE